MNHPSSGAAAVASSGCRKRRPKGSQPWKPSKDSPWNTDERLGHLFEKLGLPFDLPPAQTALCGVKAPVWDIMMDMTIAGGGAAVGPMRRLSASLPRPTPPCLEGSELLCLRDSGRPGPGDRPGRGNQLRGSARDSQTNFT